MYNETSIRLRIHEFRKRKNLSQQQLAEMTGLARTQISDIERNSNKMPSIDTLYKIANALGVTIDDLLHDTLLYYSEENSEKLSEEIIESLKYKSKEELNLILIFLKMIEKNNML